MMQRQRIISGVTHETHGRCPVKSTIVFSLSLLLFAQNVAAATYCTTKVTQVYIDGGGVVYIAGTPAGSQPYGGWQRLCSVENVLGTVGWFTCDRWAAGVARAQENPGLIVQTNYASINACSEIPNGYPIPSSVVIVTP